MMLTARLLRSLARTRLAAPPADGIGTIRTVNGETITGVFSCGGRSQVVPNAYHEPVCTYAIDVTITDSEGSPPQRYRGHATLHLSSGLLVLPNMPSPTVAIMPYAVAVMAVQGQELFQEAMATPAGGAPAPAPAKLFASDVPHVPLQPQAYAQQVQPQAYAQQVRPQAYAQQVQPQAYAQPAAAPGTVVVATAVPLMAGADAHAAYEQQLIDAEERAELAAAQRQAGVAYGVYDPALQQPANPQGLPPGQRINVLDPRNYF
jgi:hypothetical protein